MNQVENSVLNKVTAVLNSLNLKFAIIDSDGNKHGELNIEQVKKLKRRRSIYPLGLTTSCAVLLAHHYQYLHESHPMQVQACS